MNEYITSYFYYLYFIWFISMHSHYQCLECMSLLWLSICLFNLATIYRWVWFKSEMEVDLNRIWIECKNVSYYREYDKLLAFQFYWIYRYFLRTSRSYLSTLICYMNVHITVYSICTFISLLLSVCNIWNTEMEVVYIEQIRMLTI